MQMFQSATFKLTGWYLLILMAMSIIFSVIVYQINYREVTFRLENLQHGLIERFPTTSTSVLKNLSPSAAETILEGESRKASTQMILSLIYLNSAVLIAGGVGSYLLARRTLRPIEEAHEAQSRFTSDASHELRTPLAAMKAELEVTLMSKKIDAKEARETLESNLEEVDKLIDLSEMLLQLSRLGSAHLEQERVDLVVLFQNVTKRYKQQAKRFKVTSRKKAETYANKAAIIELMHILTDNALKYSPAKSEIAIRIFERHGQIGFEIKNKGKNIPDSIQARLFERFYRADTSRTESAKNGYGLGLAIAKKIVDTHHGTITVSSKNDLVTFVFYLPILKTSPVK